MTSQPSPQTEVSFEAYLSSAKDYCESAGVLLGHYDPEHADGKFRKTSPIYMLLAHAAELALKAYLLFGGTLSAHLKKTLRHDLVKIHDEALSAGLAPGELAIDLKNVLELLHAGNKEEGFRYFNLHSVSLPEIHFAAETVTALIALVEQRTGFVEPQPGPAVKLIMTIGKPTPTA